MQLNNLFDYNLLSLAREKLVLIGMKCVDLVN